MLKEAVEEAKEQMEADRDHLEEKSLGELEELEVCASVAQPFCSCRSTRIHGCLAGWLMSRNHEPDGTNRGWSAIGSTHHEVAACRVTTLVRIVQDEYSDSRALEVYRKRRVEELKASAARNKFGNVSVRT